MGTPRGHIWARSSIARMASQGSQVLSTEAGGHPFQWHIRNLSLRDRERWGEDLPTPHPELWGPPPPTPSSGGALLAPPPWPVPGGRLAHTDYREARTPSVV